MRNAQIILSALSADGEWEMLFSGPIRQLDIAWVTSMTSAPLWSRVYRVQSTNPDFGESRLPRNVAWLSNPEAPRILRVLQQEILLAWPEIGGCQAKLLRRGLAQGGAAFQVEVSQGPIWQPARVQQHRLHMAAKTGTTLSAESVPSQISGDKDETALMKSKAAFVALEAVDGVGGVRVVDLLPATWYHVRLRVTYDGSCTAVGPPVAVATKCAPPDAPMPRPKVIEEPLHPGQGAWGQRSLRPRPSGPRREDKIIARVVLQEAALRYRFA